MAKAITASDVRDALEEVSGLTLPSTLTDPKIETVVQRKTAHVLSLRGLTSLPDAGQERDLVDDAVLDLVVINIKRMLRPSNADFIKALNEEQKLIERDLRIVEETSEETGFRFDVVGGT